jgi:hypothetical protein
VEVVGKKGRRADGRRSTALREVKGPEAGRRWLCIMTLVWLPSIFAILHLHFVSSSQVSSDKKLHWSVQVCSCVGGDARLRACSDPRMRNVSILHQTVLGCREGNLGRCGSTTLVT